MSLCWFRSPSQASVAPHPGKTARPRVVLRSRHSRPRQSRGRHSMFHIQGNGIFISLSCSVTHLGSLPQKQPSLKLSPDAPPLLHLPLMFPPTSSLPLTSWCSVDLNVATYLPSFSASSLLATPDRECPSAPMLPVPSGTFSHISYIKVYATCRLRRIWLSETWPLDQRVPWEFDLYSSA